MRKQIKRKKLLTEMDDFGDVYFDYPKWYYDSLDKAKKNKICRVCGEKLPKNKRTYCSDKCKRDWSNWMGIRYFGTYPVRREIHKKFDFACTNCGEIFLSEYGDYIKVPRFHGHVHHIIPLEKGGDDCFNNLTLLCEPCHKEIHRRK